MNEDLIREDGKFACNYFAEQMPDTYTQIHLHLVFAVKYMAALIQDSWEELLYKYMTGIIQQQGHKVMAINGMPDHMHILIGMRPVQALSDLMRMVKGDSAEWINKKGLAMGYFRWQEGYGAFSYKKSDLHFVIRYIRNQKEHHAKRKFREEYRELLREFEVNFKEEYIFGEPE